MYSQQNNCGFLAKKAELSKTGSICPEDHFEQQFSLEIMNMITNNSVLRQRFCRFFQKNLSEAFSKRAFSVTGRKTSGRSCFKMKVIFATFLNFEQKTFPTGLSKLQFTCPEEQLLIFPQLFLDFGTLNKKTANFWPNHLSRVDKLAFQRSRWMINLSKNVFLKTIAL